MRAWPVVLLLIVAGCNHSPESQAMGRWEQPSGDGLEGALARAFMPSDKLDLNDDHTFILHLPSSQRSDQWNASAAQAEERIDGTWHMDQRTVVFKIETADGKPIDQVRKELADLKAKAEAAHRMEMLDEAQARLAARQSGGGVSSSAPTIEPMASGGGTAKNDAILPSRAKLSEDGKRLVVEFEDAAASPIDMVKAERRQTFP